MLTTEVRSYTDSRILFLFKLMYRLSLKIKQHGKFMKIHRFTYYSQGQWTQTKCYNHKRRSCFAMCFILALKKTFIYLCSVCSYHFVYLDLHVTVFCLLITTNAYNSFCKPNWRQKPKLHPFVNLLAPRSERSVSGHGLQFHMICNICITWIWSK